MMEVIVNGKTVSLNVGTSLLEVLKRYGFDEQSTGIAVAVNQNLIPKPQWAELILKTNDKVEIVWARQGG